MTTAWETSDEDIDTVLRAHNIQNPAANSKAASIIQEQADRVEKAALRYNEMDEQTCSALDEIEDILMENGIIPSARKKKFRPADHATTA